MRSVFFVLALCSLAPGQDPFDGAAFPQDPAEALTAARTALEADDTERGVALLWHAFERCARLDDGDARTELAADVRKEIEARDPHAEQYLSTMEACARRIVQQARGYRQKDWLEMGSASLVEAEAFDFKVCAAERRNMERVGGGTIAEVADDTVVPVPVLLRSTSRADSTTNWKRIDDLRTDAERADPETKPIPGIRCTPGAGAGELYFTKGAQGDHELVLEYRLEAEAPVAFTTGIGFGKKAIELAAEVLHSEAGKLELRLTRWLPNNEPRSAVATREYEAARPTSEWQRLVVQVRGTRLRLILNDHPPLDVVVALPPEGYVSMQVGSLDPEQGISVAIRQLATDELPEKRKRDGNLGTASARLEAVVRLRDAARGKLAYKQAEAASERLWRARALALGLPAGDERTEVVRELEELLLEHDPMTRRRLRMDPQVAENLLGLAQTYADGHPKLALLLVQRASLWDPLGAQEALDAARAAAAK